MIQAQAIINSQSYKLIAYGHCQCGCRGKTNLASKTNKQYGHLKGKPIRFINGHNACGNRNANWNGGKRMAHGYLFITAPGHPRSTNRGNYVQDHILKAEKALGKYLPKKAVVHHHTPDQLVVCQDQAYHNFIHKRKRAHEACGHANYHKCVYCKEYDSPNNLYVHANGNVSYHRKCHAEYVKGKYHENH